MSTQVKSIDITDPYGADKMAFGGFGQDLINSSFSAVAGTVYGILYVREETVISFKNRLPGGTKTVTAQTCYAGETLYGEFYDIAVASGSVRGYIKEYQV